MLPQKLQRTAPLSRSGSDHCGPRQLLNTTRYSYAGEIRIRFRNGCTVFIRLREGIKVVLPLALHVELSLLQEHLKSLHTRSFHTMRPWSFTRARDLTLWCKEWKIGLQQTRAC